MRGLVSGTVRQRPRAGEPAAREDPVRRRLDGLEVTAVRRELNFGRQGGRTPSGATGRGRWRRGRARCRPRRPGGPDDRECCRSGARTVPAHWQTLRSGRKPTITAPSPVRPCVRPYRRRPFRLARNIRSIRRTLRNGLYEDVQTGTSHPGPPLTRSVTPPDLLEHPGASGGSSLRRTAALSGRATRPCRTACRPRPRPRRPSAAACPSEPRRADVTGSASGSGLAAHASRRRSMSGMPEPAADSHPGRRVTPCDAVSPSPQAP